MAERLSEMDVEDLIRQEKKLSGDLEWMIAGERTRQEKRMRVAIHNRLVPDLYFVARLNRAGDLVLQLQIGERNAQVLRRLDADVNHTNPNELKPIGGTHKHRWTDAHKDGFAYVPNPTIDLSDYSAAIIKFLEECNIVTDGVTIRDAGRRLQTQMPIDPSFAHLRFVDDSGEVEIEEKDYDDS